jgi:hypothetical protein
MNSLSVYDMAYLVPVGGSVYHIYNERDYVIKNQSLIHWSNKIGAMAESIE